MTDYPKIGRRVVATTRFFCALLLWACSLLWAIAAAGLAPTSRTTGERIFSAVMALLMWLLSAGLLGRVRPALQGKQPSEEV